MRAITKIRKVAGVIERDLLSFQLLEQLEFVGVLLSLEVGDGIFPFPLVANVRIVFSRKLIHPLLDLLKILPCQRVVLHIEIVVETSFDGRTDAKPSSGKQRLDRCSHEMGRAVPEGIFAAVVLPLQNLDGRVNGDLPVEIPYFTVDFNCERFSS